MGEGLFLTNKLVLGHKRESGLEIIFTVIVTYTISIFSHLLRLATPSLSPRANPVKPSAKTNEAIRDAHGTRDKQMQQHVLQEPQHAMGKKDCSK